MNVELLRIVQETKDIFSFIFKPEKDLSWIPGQYIYYEIPHDDPDSRGIERHFTIASPPHEGVLRLTTKFDFKNGSTFKKALFRLVPGMTIKAYDIDGDFTITDPVGRYVIIAGGIGITPFRAIFPDLLIKEKTPDMVLLYGNSDEDIVFKDMLESFSGVNGWPEIYHIIEPQMIDEKEIQKRVVDIQKCTYYVSGPKNMVKSINSIITEMGIDKRSVKTDYFTGYE